MPDAEAAPREERLPRVERSQVVYRGAVVEVRVDRLRRPDGGSYDREVVDHPGAVVVVALDGDETVRLVRQYRHAVGRRLLELPAGTLEKGENPLATAVRELREETGLAAAEWDYLGSFFSSPGFLHEELHAFLARGLTQVGQDLEDDEDITLERVPLRELLAHPERVRDAKTLAALLLVARRLETENDNTVTTRE
ncbi:MAG: hypothetical protein Kow00122_08200 [Thermoleophilia bacterium]